MNSRFRFVQDRASSKVLFTTALLASFLAACGGSPSGVVPAPGVPAPGVSADSKTAAKKHRDAKLELRVLIPRAHKHSHYISQSTQSIVVTEGTTQFAPLNTVAASPSCSVQGAGTLCVFRLQILHGVGQTFVIKTYDQTNGLGNLLSAGTVTQNIHRGALNVLAVTLAGVPHSIVLALQGSDLSAGTAGTMPMSVMAKDADGNVIIGSGDYPDAITIATNDTKGIVTVSPTTVTAPNQTVTVSYDGRSIESASITASSAGVAAQNVTAATFSPKPTVLADFSLAMPAAIHAPHFRPHTGSQQQPTAIISGPDGNLWAAVANTVYGLIRISPQGAQTFYKAGTFPSTNLPSIAITGLAAASDGNVWYVDSDSIGFIVPGSGVVTDFPWDPSICPGPSGTRIVAAPASYGGVWATIACAADSQIVHVAADGTMTFYTLTGLESPKGLVVGKDGNVYVAGQVEANSDAGIAQAVLSGGAVVSSNVYDIASLTNLGLIGIAQSADGDLWATTGVCTPSAFVRLHVASTFATAVADVFNTLGCSKPYYLTPLADGSLWASDNAYAGAARITPGVYPAPPAQFDMLLPTPGGVAGAEFDVALGPDGNLYFSDDSSTATATGDVAKVAY